MFGLGGVLAGYMSFSSKKSKTFFCFKNVALYWFQSHIVVKKNHLHWPCDNGPRNELSKDSKKKKRMMMIMKITLRNDQCSRIGYFDD